MSTEEYEGIMRDPAVSREEKLVATYGHAPHRMSRAVYSLIDAFLNAATEAPALREQLSRAFPAYGIAVAKYEAGALGVVL